MRHGGVPSPPDIVDGLRDLLRTLPVPVVAALIYGSVAKGRHHCDSDVDALLITDRPAYSTERKAVMRLYTGFVSSLGLRPDDEYPVELFAIEGCRRMLGVSGAHPPPSCDRHAFRCSPDDAWEVLYALVTPHLVVTGEPFIDELRHAARLRLPVLADYWTFPA